MIAEETDELIGDAVVEKFGYAKKTGAVDYRKKIVSVEGFESLQIKPQPCLMAAQIRELEREIFEANNRDRLLNIDFGKYVREKTRYYNYIVTYKHLKEKNSKETRYIMKLLPKSTQYIIFERIEEVKAQLQDKQNQTLKRQYELNTELNELFKDFKRESNVNRRATESHIKERSTSMANQTMESLRIKYLTNRGRNSNLSSFSGATPKSGRLHFVIKREKVKPPNLLDPFPVKSNYDESKKVETKIKQEKEVLDLWRLRVEEHRDAVKSRTGMQADLFRPINNKSPRLSRSNSRMESNKRSPSPSNIQSHLRHQSRTGDSSFEVEKFEAYYIFEKNRHRKNILSTIIKKRSSRYVRHKGMKGLLPFDSSKAAAELLEGRPNLHRSDMQYRIIVNGHLMDTALYEIPVLYGPPKRLENTSDYDAEYKNEKINMSLKTKKR